MCSYILIGPLRFWAAVGRGLAVVLALFIALFGVGAGAGEPRPLRVGVVYLPPPADVPAARIYTPEGFEADLATELGRRLGRKALLIEVGREAGNDALASGLVDALALRVGQDEDMPATLELLPTGYASGLAVAMRTDTDISDWTDLRGRTLCVSAANQAARFLGHRLGATLAVQPAPAHSLMRVRTGECDAALHDEATLNSLFGDREWTKFSATLPPREETRLVLALPKAGGELNEQLRSALARPLEATFWQDRRTEWARNVSLEVYLDQDGPDCH